MDKILYINDTIEPKITYKGSVKILYMDKNSGKPRIIKRQNSGGPGLFSAICRMLIGLKSDQFIPSYIYGYTGINRTGMQMFTQKIRYASTPVLYETKADGADVVANNLESANAVQYTFMVPITSLKSTSQSIKSLTLYNNRDEICAQLNLDDSEIIDTSIGSNILIYWKLKFE